MKRRVCSFLWDEDNSIIENWSVDSWSSYTQSSYILKHGNKRNITNLPSETRYNDKHKTKCKVKIKRNDGNGIIGNDNTSIEVRIITM